MSRPERSGVAETSYGVPNAPRSSRSRRTRWLAWRWTDEGRRLLLEAELPAAQGAAVTSAIDRLADEIPAMPGEEGRLLVGRRRADALAALCGSGGDAADERSTIVVHVQAEALADAEASGVTDGGAVLHVESIWRLMCNATISSVIEASDGSVIGVGRSSRIPSAWVMRQLRHRDRTCTFPGCGNRRYAHAHHIEWWSRGGRTDLDNLVLVCTFHHRLVHEHGWNLQRAPDGEVRWFRPGGVRYRAGPLAA